MPRVAVIAPPRRGVVGNLAASAVVEASVELATRTERTQESREMRRPKTTGGAALAAIPLLATACEPAGDAAPAALLPEPGRPVYEAEVRPDPAAGTLEARWRIVFVPDPDAAGPVSFALARGLEIRTLEGEGVRGHEERPSSFFPAWKEVVLELEGPADGRPVSLELTYAGRPELPENRINQISPDWVELSVDSGWHPLFTTFDQEMRGSLDVLLPGDWTLAAGGHISFEGDRWVIRGGEPQLDVSFVAAPGLEGSAGERVDLLHRAGADPATARDVLEAAEACAAYLDTRYGAADALPHTTLVLADRPSNAYARIGHIVLAAVDVPEGPALSRFLCHELAHYWSRGADFMTAEHWMTEGFAEYVALRYVRERYGGEAFDEMIEARERMGRDQGPVWTEEMTARGPDPLMYGKAPVLLSRLEERLGSERFDRFLERYMTRNVTTTRELLQHLGEVAGTEAAEWFRSLLAAAPDGDPPDDG